MSTIAIESPRWRSESRSVRTRHAHQRAIAAREVHTFWPLMTTSPSLTRPTVRTAARSEPAPGSENPWHHSSLASSIPGRKRCCWDSSPRSISVGPIM